MQLADLISWFGSVIALELQWRWGSNLGFIHVVLGCAGRYTLPVWLVDPVSLLRTFALEIGRSVPAGV
jgi:hypothetical protein